MSRRSRPRFGARRLPASTQPVYVWPVAAAAVLVPLAYLMRFGYAFGFSDQDEFLPWLLERLEPGTLAGDWFVASQMASFNIRSGFVAILELPSRALGAEWGVLLVYVASAAGLVSAILRLARSLGAKDYGLFLAPLLTLVLLPRWTLGGNAAVASMLVPSILAWAACLWALVHTFRRQPLLAGLLVGVAAWIQVLVAAQVGFLLLAALLWRERRVGGEVLRFSLPALALALPVALLLWKSGAGAPGESFAILSVIRAPHHYDPGSFPLSDYIQFGLLAALGGLALRGGRLRRAPAANRLLTGLFLAIGFGLAVGLAAWALDLGTLLSLQPFKLTVPAQVLLSVGICAVLPRWRLPRWAWITALLMGIGLWGWLAAGGTVQGRPALRGAPGPSGAAAAWIRSQSPAGTTIAVPPSTTGFALAARRPATVTFKSFPFTAAAALEWYQAMSAWAPGVLPEEPDQALVGGTSLLPPLDAAYETLDAAALRSLMDRYGADWAVRATPLPAPDSTLVHVAVAGGYHVYAIEEVRPDSTTR